MHVLANLVGKVQIAANHVTTAFMATTVNRNADVKTVLPATLFLVLVNVLLVIEALYVLNLVLKALMENLVLINVIARTAVLAIMLQENVSVHQDGLALFVLILAHLVIMAKCVKRDACATMERHVII